MKSPLPKPQSIDVTDVHFTGAPPADVETGLLGWVRFILNDILRIDSVAVRITLRGRVTLSFPARRDRAGREHKLMRPVNAKVGREIEYQVLRAMGGSGRPAKVDSTCDEPPRTGDTKRPRLDTR